MSNGNVTEVPLKVAVRVSFNLCNYCFVTRATMVLTRWKLTKRHEKRNRL